MKKSRSYFKHIYIENSALEHEITREITSKFKNISIILVKNYLEIFGRKKQSFLLQKAFPSLILARKQKNFLYPNPPYCQNFGFERSFYASMVLNCIFDCKYCFLQGMYSSAYIVIFVNIEDLFCELERELKNGNFLLFISYDTDLLALEYITNYIHRIYEFAKKNRELTIEIRTKSSNFRVIEDLAPISNIILAWSILPDKIIKTFETNTPLLKKRLESINNAMSKGWNVRLCFDPLIFTKESLSDYEKMLEILAETIETKKIYDISVGNFRMNKSYLKKITSIRLEILKIENEDSLYFEKILKKISSIFIDKKIYSLYNKPE
ncbi:MAG: SPL family radical SAM protein [Brevinematia bacterium]